MARFEPCSDLELALGESPVWDPEAARLLFVDITGRRIHRYDPRTGRSEAVEVEADVGCVAPVRGGGLLAALRTGLWLLQADGRPLRRLADPPEDPRTARFNDGRVDPRGRVFVGTIDETKTGTAGLYRYDRRGLQRIKTGLRTSNGLALSPDGRRLYHSDTPRFTIFRHAYDPATGELGPEEVFARLDPDSADRARPDGAAVDAEGAYFSALYDGGRVRRYGSGGEILGEYEAPGTRPTMPAFGGEALDILFLTTAADPGGPGRLCRLDAAAPAPGLAGAAFDPQA